MNRDRKRLLLRLLLAGAGAGWAVSAIGLFLPWPVAVRWLQDFGGAGPIPDDPMARYWLRMASGAFAFVGALFLACAWNPGRHSTMIPLLGALSLFQGAVLLYFGLALRLGPMPFAADVAICLVPGFGLLVLHRSAAAADEDRKSVV